MEQAGFLLQRGPAEAVAVEGAHDGVGISHIGRPPVPVGTHFEVLDWAFPPGSSEGPHHHGDDGVGVEWYYLLEGTLVLTLDGEDIDLHPGDSVAIRPETERGVRNTGHTDARIILVYELPHLTPPA